MLVWSHASPLHKLLFSFARLVNSNTNTLLVYVVFVSVFVG
jgi:hypothetical protein